MPKPRAKLDRLGQSEEVLKRLKTEPPGLARERLNAVKLGLEGELNLEEIAKVVGKSRATIQTWFDLYRSEGIERLCRRSDAPTGRPSLLDSRAEKELKKKLAKGSFRRVADAHQWLASRFNIKVSEATVRN